MGEVSEKANGGRLVRGLVNQASFFPGMLGIVAQAHTESLLAMKNSRQANRARLFIRVRKERARAKWGERVCWGSVRRDGLIGSGCLVLHTILRWPVEVLGSIAYAGRGVRVTGDRSTGRGDIPGGRKRDGGVGGKFMGSEGEIDCRSRGR